MNLRLTLVFWFLTGITFNGLAQSYKLNSPDRKINIEVTVNERVQWGIKYNDEVLLAPSAIALDLSSMQLATNKPAVKKAVNSIVNKVIESPVPVKNKLIPEQYNELKINFKGNYTITFRAYDNGVAYRFETDLPEQQVTVKSETAEFNFPDNFQIAWPVDEPFEFWRSNQASPEPGFGSVNPPSRSPFGGPPQVAGNMPGSRNSAPAAPPMRMARRSPFNTSYEYLFRDSTLNAIADTAGLPIYLSTAKGTKMVLLEADLYDYPNLFVKGNRSASLAAVFPHVVVSETEAGPMSRVTKTADYMAQTSGKRTYPWRAIAISPDDKGLLQNELVYKLASPPVISTEWIQPGQVAWEWWHGSNLFNVDFQAGINTASYKYYIDFASKYGIRYILIDAGWAGNKEVDIPTITAYAQTQNVGVMLWVSWRELLPTLDNTLDQFRTWGVKGVKMDYMDRADQEMVNIFEKVASATAKRQMLIDFHGTYKPSGLNRKYPNVVNYEGVKGLEHNKLGSSRITPSHDVALLFTRMVAGPIDYTPGALHNAGYGNFRNISSEPMSQGTRAHQAAMYVMYDAPIQMLADNPSVHVQEEPYTKFITSIPTVWDRTIGIDGKIGQYAVLARQKGDNWYVGAMTDWSNRELTLNLDFLEPKKYQVTIVADGLNADTHGSDHTIKTQQVTKGDQLKISMRRGGGWAAIIKPL